MSKNFFENYFSKQIKLFKFDKHVINELLKVKKYLKLVKKNKNKVIIFGNGGSAAIANHFSVDLTKISKIRCVNFNESSLLTCFQMTTAMKTGLKRQ